MSVNILSRLVRYTLVLGKRSSRRMVPVSPDNCRMLYSEYDTDSAVGWLSTEVRFIGDDQCALASQLGLVHDFTELFGAPRAKVSVNLLACLVRFAD